MLVSFLKEVTLDLLLAALCYLYILYVIYVIY